MIYIETDQDHWLVWPVLAIGLGDEFWIGIGWLNCEIGWRNGNGGLSNQTPKEQTP